MQFDLVSQNFQKRLGTYRNIPESNESQSFPVKWRHFMASWVAALPALEKPRFTGPELLEVRDFGGFC